MMENLVDKDDSVLLELIVEICKNPYLLLGSQGQKSRLLAWPVYKYHCRDIHNCCYGSLEPSEVFYGL